jgi:5-methylcytosine-specific restriction protein A
MSDAVYRHRAWKPLARKVLERDGYVCQIRLPGCTGRATAADHVVEWRDGGAKYDMANLQAACAACNTAKRNRRQAVRARRSLRPW